MRRSSWHGSGVALWYNRPRLRLVNACVPLVLPAHLAVVGAEGLRATDGAVASSFRVENQSSSLAPRAPPSHQPQHLWLEEAASCVADLLLHVVDAVEAVLAQLDGHGTIRAPEAAGGMSDAYQVVLRIVIVLRTTQCVALNRRAHERRGGVQGRVSRLPAPAVDEVAVDDSHGDGDAVRVHHCGRATPRKGRAGARGGREPFVFRGTARAI